MSDLRSDLNVSIIEGVLVADPTHRELGENHVTEASIVTTERWMKGNEPKERVSYLGLVAHGQAARLLAVCKKGVRLWVVGRWCTIEGPPGPRGGKNSSTKCRVIHLIPKLTDDALTLLAQVASNPESNLFNSHQQ